MTSTTNKKTLMDSAVQDFRERMESSLPLRNCCDFYSEARIREMTDQEKDRILDKYIQNPPEFLLREELCSEINKLVEQLRKKNEERRKKSESLMETIIDSICAVYKNVLVVQMEMGQKMEEMLFEKRKQEAFRSFQECWNWHLGNKEFHDEQKEKLERKLDLIRGQIRGDLVDTAEETPVPNLRSCQNNGASEETCVNADGGQPKESGTVTEEAEAISSNIPVLETHVDVQNNSTGNDVTSSSIINPANPPINSTAMSMSDPDSQAGNEDDTPIIIEESDSPIVTEKTKAISSTIPALETQVQNPVEPLVSSTAMTMSSLQTRNRVAATIPLVSQKPQLQSLRRSSRVKSAIPKCSTIVPGRRRRKHQRLDQYQCPSANPEPGPSSLPMPRQQNSTSLQTKIVMNPERCSDDLATTTTTPNLLLANSATTTTTTTATNVGNGDVDLPEQCLRRSSRLKDTGRPNYGPRPQRRKRKVIAELEPPRSSSNETLSSLQNSSGGNQVAPMPSTSRSHGRTPEAQKSKKKRPPPVSEIEMENWRPWDKYPVTGTVHYPNYIEFLGWAHPLFQCNFCKKKFKTKSCLKNHGRDVCMKRDNFNFYKCNQCQESFTVRKHFENHIRSHPGLKPFTCEECNQGFVTHEKLRDHKNIHIGNYACGQCSRTFSSHKDLCRHLVIHSGQYPYKCSICGSQWRRKDNLVRHIKKLHKKPKDVSKKLADKAAVDYFRMNPSLDNIPAKRINSAVFASVLKNANLTPSRPHSVANRRNIICASGGSGSVTRSVPSSSTSTSAPPANPREALNVEDGSENDIEVAMTKIMQIYDLKDFKQESETEVNQTVSVSLSAACPSTSTSAPPENLNEALSLDDDDGENDIEVTMEKIINIKTEAVGTEENSSSREIEFDNY